MKELYGSLNNLNSKLVCLRFKIERKCIKNEAREERRQSIIKLEQEKNLNFHPKRDRSKSIPIINMNIRLKALKEMKEEILMKKSKIAEEINDEDISCKVPVMFYNHNDIRRDILHKPFQILIKPEIN